MLCEHCTNEFQVPRTGKQRDILAYYRDYIRREGHVPSYATIARHFGFTSKATVAKHLGALRRQGFIERPARADKVS